MVRLLAISISSGEGNKLGVRWVISKKEPLEQCHYTLLLGNSSTPKLDQILMQN